MKLTNKNAAKSARAVGFTLRADALAGGFLAYPKGRPSDAAAFAALADALAHVRDVAEPSAVLSAIPFRLSGRGPSQALRAIDESDSLGVDLLNPFDSFWADSSCGFGPSAREWLTL